jgi:hypothetical protein
LTRIEQRVLVSGVAAGIVANYWVLEGLLADRSHPAAAWISDLGARSESTGWIFDLLDFSSGVLIVAFALAVRPLLAERSRALRWGVTALAAVGVCTMIDGAFPLSCAESLSGSCELRYDAVDLIHGAETFISIGITVFAFGFLALGFTDDGNPDLERLGTITAIAGVLWVVCQILMGAGYALDDLEQVKGVFHRGSQVVLGSWIVVLAFSLQGLAPARGAKPSPGLGRIDGDGEATEPIRLS